MKLFLSCAVLSLLLLGVFGIRQPIPARPLKVVYINGYYPNGPQQAVIDASNAGYNVIVLAFYMSDDTTGGIAASWEVLSDTQQRQTVDRVHANGGVVLVSMGGATDQAWLNMPGSTVGSMAASWAIANNLDGVDFDLEGAPGMAFTSAIVTKYTDAINAAAALIKPAGGQQGVISAAPYAPWFGPVGTRTCSSYLQLACTWVGPSGGMTGVYANVGSKIDYLFVQYYNQLTYDTENSLFVDSTLDYDGSWAWFPQTSVKQIANSGIPIGKIVVGKPVNTQPSSGADGYVSPATLNRWIVNQGLFCTLGGVGIWEWKPEAPAWRAAAWPSSGGPQCTPKTSTTTTTITTTTTTTAKSTTTTTTTTTTAKPSTTTTSTSSVSSTTGSAPPSSNPCDTFSSGNWCYNGGYVTCPFTAVRPCQTGLVCQQADEGIVYCV